jgi:hypothetical protein
MEQEIETLDNLINSVKQCNNVPLTKQSVELQANCVSANAQAKQFLDMCAGKKTSSGGLVGSIGHFLGGGESAAQKALQKSLCKTYGSKLSAAYYESAYSLNFNLWKYVPWAIGIIILIVVLLYLKNKK